jgi:hypothetical protein
MSTFDGPINSVLISHHNCGGNCRPQGAYEVKNCEKGQYWQVAKLML